MIRCCTAAPTLRCTRGKIAWGCVALIMALAFLAGPARPANSASPTSIPQVLPLPPLAPVSHTPAPLPPPINPGYAPAETDGLSPILHESVPVYELPQSPAPSYPAPQLPGPIDQQKLQAYRNDLNAQQWQLQSRGSLAGTLRGREILQQLNAPDAQ